MYQDTEAKMPSPLASRGLNSAVTGSAPPTVNTFLQENDRLLQGAHEAITQLEDKLFSLLPRAEGAVGNSPSPPQMAANSELAASLRDQGETIQGLIRRLSNLRHALDLS